MEIDSMLLEVERYTVNANAVKLAVLYQLRKDNVITEEQCSHYLDDWQVIIFKSSWFSRLRQRLSGADANKWEYKYVKFEDKK